MKKYFPLLKHKKLELISEDIYQLTGTMKLFGIFQYSRNMHIIKEGGELAIVNPVRVDKETLKEIESLGKICHIYKIGQLHGVDVPFYMDKYRPKLWMLEGQQFKRLQGRLLL